jgi:hypothetical protein
LWSGRNWRILLPHSGKIERRVVSMTEKYWELLKKVEPNQSIFLLNVFKDNSFSNQKNISMWMDHWHPSALWYYNLFRRFQWHIEQDEVRSFRSVVYDNRLLTDEQ